MSAFRREMLGLWAGCVCGLLVQASSPSAAPPPLPLQQIAHYPGAPGKPIEDKVSLGTAQVLDQLLRINLQFGQNVRPRTPALDHPLIERVRTVLRTLPAEVHRIASDYVLAVFLVEQDAATGAADFVQDSGGRWHYSLLMFNLTALTRTANAWASWKENSAFRQLPGFRIAVTIEPPEQDTVDQAIQFIVLHELGHALAVAREVHEVPPLAGPLARGSPFIAQSWQPGPKSALVSRFAGRFPKLDRAGFYRFEEAPLRLADAEAVYRALAETDLPSYYGLASYYDDFAETFAIYVHTRMLGKPYKVDIYEHETLRYTYTSCIVANTCPQKVRALEAVLKLK